MPRLGNLMHPPTRIEPGEDSVLRRVAVLIGRINWKWAVLLVLYVLAAVQFVGSEIYLEFPFVDVHLWEHGLAPLPFQTRILLAPLYLWVDTSPWCLHLAATLVHNNPYFFPRGLEPNQMLEFFVGIGCVLFSGWVAWRIYTSATRRNLLGPLVFPLFLMMCTVTYIVHTVQNFRYMYDFPSLACFSLGFYLMYFRKSNIWFVLLFLIGTLNRETTLLLLPFWVLAYSLENGRLNFRRIFKPYPIVLLSSLLGYWILWHHIIFHIFAHNPSQYYSRVFYNLRFLFRMRYLPQVAASFGFVWPLLIFYRKKLFDPQLRVWLYVLPGWYALMMVWAVITELRVFGELLPIVAPVAALIGEELLAVRMMRLHAFDDVEQDDIEQAA
jgi:hypothetical protein